MGTLKGALKYGDVLSGVERADLWSLTTSLEGKELGGLADHLVNRTSVFVNPNKHRWRVWRDGAEAETVRSGAWVLVWDSEETEGRRAHAELRGAGFEEEIKNVSKATLWRLSFEDAAKGSELSLAEEMAVAVGREQGLLANPHIHRWVCGEGDIELEEAVSHLEVGRK